MPNPKRLYRCGACHSIDNRELIILELSVVRSHGIRRLGLIPYPKIEPISTDIITRINPPVLLSALIKGCNDGILYNGEFKMTIMKKNYSITKCQSETWIYLFSGKCHIQIDSGLYILKPNDTCLIKPGQNYLIFRGMHFICLAITMLGHGIKKYSIYIG